MNALLTAWENATPAERQALTVKILAESAKRGGAKFPRPKKTKLQEGRKATA